MLRDCRVSIEAGKYGHGEGSPFCVKRVVEIALRCRDGGDESNMDGACGLKIAKLFFGKRGANLVSRFPTLKTLPGKPRATLISLQVRSPSTS